MLTGGIGVQDISFTNLSKNRAKETELNIVMEVFVVMNELVKKELVKNVKAINNCLNYIVEEKLPTKELIKLEFESIRCLIDYSEKIAIEGESAIETLD